MFTLENKDGSLILTVTTNYQDKTYNNKYRAVEWVQEDTLRAWLNNQNPEFLNKNVRDYLLTNGIVVESGSKKLLADLMAQVG